MYNLGGSGEMSDAYVLRPNRYSTMSTDEIIDYCALNSIVPRAYIGAAMTALAQCIENFLLNGHSVQFPCLGTFSLQSNGFSEPDHTKAGLSQFEKLRIRFLPCAALKSKVDDIDLECEGVFDIAGEVTLPSGKKEKYYKKVHDAADPTYLQTLSVGTGMEAMGSVAGGGSFAEGTEITIHAVANSGYTFKGWKLNGNPGYESTSADYTYEVEAANSWVAEFEAEAAQVTLTVGQDTNPNWGNIQIDDRTAAQTDTITVAAGTEVTIKAIANTGYSFSSWSDGNTSATRTITLTENKTLNASFESR